MKVVVKSGDDTYFWFDNWLEQGRLIDITGDAGTIHLGLPRTARVSDVVSNGCWNIRNRRGRLFPELYRQIVETQAPPLRMVLTSECGDTLIISSRVISLPQRLGSKFGTGEEKSLGAR